MIYKTKTKIENRWVVIKVYANGVYWFTYDFLIDLAEMMLTEHLPHKRWASKNLDEIRQAIEKHLNEN
jgi:hypothetical protein